MTQKYVIIQQYKHRKDMWNLYNSNEGSVTEFAFEEITHLMGE